MKKQFTFSDSRLRKKFHPWKETKGLMMEAQALCDVAQNNCATVSDNVRVRKLTAEQKLFFETARSPNRDPRYLAKIKAMVSKNHHLLHTKDEFGFYLVHWAAKRNSLATFQWLAKSFPNHKHDLILDDAGRTPYKIAKRLGNRDVYKWIEDLRQQSKFRKKIHKGLTRGLSTNYGKFENNLKIGNMLKKTNKCKKDFAVNVFGDMHKTKRKKSRLMEKLAAKASKEQGLKV
jgi:ankyrin repeat protein